MISRDSLRVLRHVRPKSLSFHRLASPFDLRFPTQRAFMKVPINGTKVHPKRS